MKFDNLLPVNRLPIRRDGNAAHRYRMRPVVKTASAGGALLSGPGPRRSGPLRKVMHTVATCGDFVFHGFILTVMSWTVAQVLEGCAAYAYGMYPYAPVPDGQPGARPEHGFDDGRSAIAELQTLKERGGAESSFSNVEYLERRRIRHE